ncbi:p1/s1 nuclease [Plasmodium brasilianum]|uniref:p1/s1 nuclease, putative n=2 Tax=Plasmodium (Plasmodium) TaxID=418103 RepID=A0A1A8W9R8_PLAMA|nr:p1/s1 nuclease, putative [Plasmodium malariae]KAI4835881.1 p1/s1 nuclease [Plasmodium brasilianum]SBS89774.1 hypothetical protein PMALA_027370 [Plasmodium malariae]SCP02818.1 p1/s1 nuclease, putative [Plasmodium malariae]
MNKETVCYLLFFLIFAKRITCWSDEGHMLSTAIAYEGLTKEEKLILEKIFKNYKEDKDFNDPIYASIWADHIKPFDIHYPNNIRRSGGIDLMNKWHYIDTPYNPLNVRINIFQEYYYKNTDNALTVLKRIFKLLKSIKRKENFGTFFSYNFNLRYFIHIFGDIHQPLHVITFYNNNFINGDNGGRDINILYKNKVENLHYLCDCVFHSRRKKWPTVTPKEVIKEAKSLMNLYPPEYFGNRLKNDLNEYEYLDFIISDSYNKCVHSIYYNFPHETLNKNTSYDVTNFFVVNLKKTLNEQIVLGGYRLTHYLKVIIANIPPDLVNTNKYMK